MGGVCPTACRCPGRVSGAGSAARRAAATPGLSAASRGCRTARAGGRRVAAAAGGEQPVARRVDDVRRSCRGAPVGEDPAQGPQLDRHARRGATAGGSPWRAATTRPLGRPLLPRIRGPHGEVDGPTPPVLHVPAGGPRAESAWPPRCAVIRGRAAPVARRDRPRSGGRTGASDESGRPVVGSRSAVLAHHEPAPPPVAAATRQPVDGFGHGSGQRADLSVVVAPEPGDRVCDPTLVARATRARDGP